MKNRTDYISELNSFLNLSKLQFQQICQDLGWNDGPEHSSPDDMAVCPLDNSHRMPKKSLPLHIEKCSLHSKGYSENSVLFPPACGTGSDTIVIDEKTLDKILKNRNADSSLDTSALHQKAVPLTSDRLMSDFTSEDRLALYDYAIKNTVHCSEENMKEINLPTNDAQDAKTKTLEELAAAGRDAKRRRIRYKSRKVHTNRKSRTEVLREVIQSHMEGYVEWVKQEAGESVQEGNDQDSSRYQRDEKKPIEDETDSSKPIKHDWENWGYFGTNPHNRYINVLKEQAAIKQREEHRKSRLEPSSESRKRNSYNNELKFNEDYENYKYNRKASEYRRYEYDTSHHKRKREDYRSSKSRRNESNDSSYRHEFEESSDSWRQDESKSEKRKSKEDYSFDLTKIKTEPTASCDYQSHRSHYKDDRKRSKESNHESYKSSKYYSSKDYDRYDHFDIKKEFERKEYDSKKNLSFTKYQKSSSKTYSESDRESTHYYKKSSHRHKSSHKHSKKVKHRSKKKKQKRYSSTESSESESKSTDDDDSSSN